MPKMKKIIVVASLFIALVAGGVGVWYWQSIRKTDAEGRLVLYGNVDIRQIDLAFNVSERILRIEVEEGNRVAKGQLLASLDSEQLQYEVDRAQARVLAQREVVAKLEAGSRSQEIDKARAEVKAAAVRARDTARTYRRLKSLAGADAVSREKADNAKAAADRALAELKAAEETLALAIAGPRQEDIAAASATLQAYAAELSLAREKLADAELHAPVEGIIRERILEPGDLAFPERPVFTLALTDPVWVRTYVSEPNLGKLRPGMAAKVSTDSYPDREYKAWVGFISPTAEFTPKTVETPDVRTSLVYQVRIFVCNPRNELRLGMPATVTLNLNQPVSEDHTGMDPCKNQ
jgi:HlyD family secretion protein